MSENVYAQKGWFNHYGCITTLLYYYIAVLLHYYIAVLLY